MKIEKEERLVVSAGGSRVKGISQYTLSKHLRNFGIIISKACEKENLNAMYKASNSSRH